MRKAHYWILANRRDPKTQISNDTSLPWPMTRRCSFIASGYAWNKRALGECKRLSTSAGSNCWRTVTEHDLTVIKKDAFVWVLTLCRVSLLPSWVIGDKLFSLFLYLYHKHEQLSKTYNRMQERRDLKTKKHVQLPANRAKNRSEVRHVCSALVLRDNSKRTETRTQPRNIGLRWIRKIYSGAFKI